MATGSSESRTVRIGVLAGLLLVVVAGAALLWVARQEPTETFCSTALPIRDIDGRTVVVQENAASGPDCALDETHPEYDTLGIDCKVRAPDGTVVTTATSTRDDGPCGADSPR